MSAQTPELSIAETDRPPVAAHTHCALSSGSVAALQAALPFPTWQSAQLLLGDDYREDWKYHWRNMPAYTHGDLMPWKRIELLLEGPDDLEALAKMLGRGLTCETRSAWLKPQEKLSDARYVWRAPKCAPKYPIYIISKGRHESRKTARALEKMGCPYRIVVEPQEAELYASVIAPEKILVLPFSNLGQGSIPARNWVWEHAKAEGHARHWIMDDNIHGFMRFHNNRKLNAETPAIFCAVENFVDRYHNLAQASLHYDFFAIARKHYHPAFLLNHRCYSCILIDNAIPHRWRGRYNEDTDLSLRILKDGLCTAVFYAFLQRKAATMSMKGGNTDELYAGDGRKLMAESLHAQHPDVCTVSQKWGRPQHHVDYSGFRSQLIPRGELPEGGLDEFGMFLDSAND